MSIRSLSDMRREDEKDPNKKTTSSFTGGERSGLAVENPYDGDEENGEALGPNPLGGYAHVVRGRAPPGARRVTIYKNGFLLDEGNFRSLDDPENVRFLEELKAGFAPRELQEGGRQVHIELVNEHTETYTPPPPPAYVLFSGEGQTLNSSSGASGSTSAATSAAGAVDVTRGEVTVQEDAPTTTLQFRFHDGQRRAQRFNESHTIADVRAFVSQYVGRLFSQQQDPIPLSSESVNVARHQAFSAEAALHTAGSPTRQQELRKQQQLWAQQLLPQAAVATTLFGYTALFHAGQ